MKQTSIELQEEIDESTVTGVRLKYPFNSWWRALHNVNARHISHHYSRKTAPSEVVPQVIASEQGSIQIWPHPWAPPGTLLGVTILGDPRCDELNLHLSRAWGIGPYGQEMEWTLWESSILLVDQRVLGSEAEQYPGAPRLWSQISLILT